MKQHKKSKRTLILALTGLILLSGSWKFFQLAAAPVKDKDCNFVYPTSTDQTKPTTIISDWPDHLRSITHEGGIINDASCLNQTAVYGVVQVTTENDIRDAILFAKEQELKITAAGQRHSMGGQSFSRHGLVLDMRNFNEMTVDVESKVLTVQSGATWAQVQQYLDAQGLSVKAMQSINIFTVGGTLSVNAHGIAHTPGPIASTVRSLRVMQADGTIVTASLTENAELFRHVLGGYGLFGVILDVQLDIVENELYDWKTTYLEYQDFPAYYREHVLGNDTIGLMYARISVSPTSYLTQTALHTYVRGTYEESIPALVPAGQSWISRFVINFSKTGKVGRWLRWTLERNAERWLHGCLSRNQAMSQKEVCLVVRNQKMYDSMAYLKNRLPDADILQEYFLPYDQMPVFVDQLRTIVTDNEANLLNVTIRNVEKDTVTALPYAREDMFAFVLYFNQGLNEADSAILQKTTVDLIDAATALGGTYYLPYQLYYSPEQLRTSYPSIDTFFQTKLKYDPAERFSNALYEKYASKGSADTL